MKVNDFDGVANSLEESAKIFFEQHNGNLFRSNTCHHHVNLNNNIGINVVDYDMTSSNYDLKKFN